MKTTVSSSNIQSNVQQIIYLDFDGEITSYNGEILQLEDVVLSPSELSSTRIADILNHLNESFKSYDVVFTTQRPAGTEYSTIFIGYSQQFAPYNFTGIAETVDIGNYNKTDNAFVFLDATASDVEIINVITHEAGHLLGLLDHSGIGIDRYAHKEQLTGTVNSAKVNRSEYNCTLNCGTYNTARNVTVNSDLSVSNGGNAYNVTVNNDAKLTVLNKGYVENVTVIGSGSYLDNAQMLVYKGSTVKDINLAGGELLITDNGCKLTGELVLGGTKGGVNGSLMLSVKDDNIHDYVDPDWSDLNIVFDITSMNPAYLKTSAGGMDVYFSDTRSIETPISYVDPANFIIRVSSGAEGGYYWLTNAEIDMTTYKPITFTKDVIFELDGQIVGTFKWNKSKKAYELKTNSGYKASDYKDYKLYSNSMPTSITAHNLPGVVFTCKKPDPVLLYDAEDKIVASKKEFSGRFDVTIDGSEINKVVANEKGIVKNVVMTENSQLELNEGAKFLGNNTIAGNVKITGALANTQKDNISLTFDISACKEDESAPILDGYEFITDNVSGLTISVSAEKPESDEAEYILIDNIGSIQDSNLKKIAFTVNGKTLKEEYKGQYTFTWDKEYKKYTGINYNGYNYTLSTENNQLTLSVDKNIHTLLLYLDGDDNPSGKTIAGKLNDIISVLKDKCKMQGNAALSNEICILVYADAFESSYGDDGIYSIVGEGAICFEEKEELFMASSNELKKILIDGKKFFSAEDYSLLVWDHGDGIYGLCYDDDDKYGTGTTKNMSINDFANAFTVTQDSAICDVSNICIDACYMSSLEFMSLLNKNTSIDNVVASAEITHTNTFNYRDTINSISKDPNGDIEKIFFNSYSDSTISSVSLNGIDKIIKALNLTAKYLLDEIKDDETWINIVKAANGALSYNIQKKRYSNGYRGTDLGVFLNNLSKHLSTGSMAKAAASVTLDYIKQVVQVKTTKYAYRKSSGISVYIPTTKEEYAYELIQSTMPTNWVKLLDRIMEYDKYVNKNTDVYFTLFNKNDQNKTQLGIFNGDDTLFSNVVVSDYDSSEFLFILTDEGQKNDSITIKSTGANNDLNWVLYNSSNVKIQSGCLGEDIQLNGLSKGEYEVELIIPDETVVDIKFNADWSAGDDHIDYFQSNDSIENATELLPFSLTGLSVEGDDLDWFKFYATNSSNKITISNPDSIQGLTISLFDKNGNFVEFLTPAEGTPGVLTYSSMNSGYLAIQSSNKLRHSYSIVSELSNTDIRISGSDFQQQLSIQVQKKDKYVLGDVYLASGKFQISGNFSNLSGKISLLNSKGKTVEVFSVTNGTLKENISLLSNDKYTLVFSLTSKLSTNVDLSIDITGKVFTQADNSDDWLDVKYAGPRGNVSPAKVIKESQHIFVQNWVGFGDEIDYQMFDLVDGAKLSFTVEGSDAAKFAIYSLVEKIDKKGNVTYSLKTLQNNTLKLDKASGKYIVDTKDLLLENGTYYFSMTSTNAKKGGDCDYTVTVNDNSVFFTRGDDNSNDWLYDKKSGSVNDTVDSIGKDDAIGLEDWVGFGDAVDYHSFELTSAAKLSFNVNADDASKFAIYQLQEKVDKKGNVSYSLKTLQSNTLKLDKTSGKYIVDTKELLLTRGTYYVSMTSSNAAKGGDAAYAIALNDDSEFFAKGDDGSNNWLYDKKTKTVNEDIVSISSDADINHADWVGFGDDSDFFKFELTSSARLSFDLFAGDPAKFSIMQLDEKVDKKGNVSYSVKTLQNTALKSKQNITTKELLLTGGTYYISMVSTGAKKGDSVDYSIAVNENSTFYPACNNQDDSWKLAETQDSWNFADEIKDWVGYGDTTDFIKFEVDESGKLSFELDEATAAAVKNKTLKLSCVDAKGKTVALSGLNGTELTSKKELSSGVYYIGVSCTKPKETDVSYGFSLGIA